MDNVRTVKALCEVLKQSSGWELRGRELRRFSLSDQVLDCPITYAARAVLGLEFRPHCYDSAAKALGLPLVLANEIARAADIRGGSSGQIRRRLLGACGFGGVVEGAL